MDKNKIEELNQLLNELSTAEILGLPAIQSAVGEAHDILVSAVPKELREREYSEAHMWDVHVLWRGKGLYAVEARGKQYTKDLVGAFESNPSSRTDRFKKSHRFSLEQALSIAKKLAPKIVINNMTIADYALWCRACDEVDALEAADPTGTYGRVKMDELYAKYYREAHNL